jgi:hypothetical protein
MADNGDVGVLAAGGKVFALRGEEDVQDGRQGALVDG